MIDPWLRELRRRRVLRGTGAYVIVAWVGVQAVWALVEAPTLRSLALWLAIAGLPLSALFSWVFQVTREHGLQLEHPKGAQPPASAAGRALDFAVAWGVAVVLVATIWLWRAGDDAARVDAEDPKPGASRLFMND